MDLLLDHGADPRQTCMTGETALHFAVSLRHVEAAETLLKRSQDLVNEADKVRVLLSKVKYPISLLENNLNCEAWKHGTQMTLVQPIAGYESTIHWSW